MKIEIHYPDKRVETHRGVKTISYQKGQLEFSKGLSIKSKRYHTSEWQFEYFAIMEEENDGGSKNKD